VASWAFKKLENERLKTYSSPVDKAAGHTSTDHVLPLWSKLRRNLYASPSQGPTGVSSDFQLLRSCERRSFPLPGQIPHANERPPSVECRMQWCHMLHSKGNALQVFEMKIFIHQKW